LFKQKPLGQNFNTNGMNNLSQLQRFKQTFYFVSLQSIYVDGVRMFGAEQLQEIVDLMTEKELRVQIPVEELDILMS
jgi:hypothetical protein